MTATFKTSDAHLLRQWRQQLAVHGSRQHVAGRQGFAALTFLDNTHGSTRFVDINNLFVLLLFEEDNHYYDRTPLRLCGYKVSRIPHGVQWGGAENCKLFKDVKLAPQYGARGQRLDRSRLDLLEHTLRLDRRLSRAARHRAAPWNNLQLPRLWAGFRLGDTAALFGECPDFESERASHSTRANDFFYASAQRIEGLTCYPLNWVSGHLDGAVAVFSEVSHRLRRQISRIGNLPDGLIGFRGAIMFDFYSSAFREQTGKRLKRRDNTFKKCAATQRMTFLTMPTQTDCTIA